MNLSILIPTLPQRKEMFESLCAEIRRQAIGLSLKDGVDFEILSDDGILMTTGAKRNILVQRAKGEYTVFIDDDDWIDERYLEAIHYNYTDVVAISGTMTIDGAKTEYWECDTSNNWETIKGIHYRPITHLCPIKREIALQVPFPDKTTSEDYDYAMDLIKSKLIEDSTSISLPIYEYRYKPMKTDTTKINLFVPEYIPSNPDRLKEINECIEKNKQNPHINYYALDTRNFRQILSYINKHSTPNDINILSNADIYFDDTLLEAAKIKAHEVYALSRHDVKTGGSISFHNHSDSQDTWIFKGWVRDVNCNFDMGTAGFDNRLAHELVKSGYNVTNPSKTIKTYHLHLSDYRTYKTGKGHTIPEPYLHVEPCELNEVKKNKILHIALNSGGIPQHGLQRALQSMGEYYEIDWMALLSQYGEDKNKLKEHILGTVNGIHPDFTFMQLQTPYLLDAETVSQFTGKVVNWTGDVRAPLPKWYKDLGKAPNLITLFTNMNDVETMRDYGCKADYLQIGFDKNVYKKVSQKIKCPEIVFMGNNYSHFPLSQLRYDMVQTLKETYGDNFATYGVGWDNGENLNGNPERENLIYNNCKIAINLSHFDYGRYSSDRLFRILGAGAFCLTKSYPDMDLDLTVGSNVAAWEDIEGLIGQIDYYLSRDEDRQRIAKSGYNYVHKYCTWEYRIKELEQLIAPPLNINTPEYWDNVYSGERGTGKRRVDNARLNFLVEGMKDWKQYNPYLTNPNILDVGCGNAELLMMVHAHFPDWDKIGYDICEKTLHQNKKDNPTMTFHRKSIESKPDEHDKYHIVFCGETLEHLDKPKDAFKNLFTLTAKGGYVIISVPNEEHNPSPEHMTTFSLNDVIDMGRNYGTLKNIRITNNSLSIIASFQKL